MLDNRNANRWGPPGTAHGGKCQPTGFTLIEVLIAVVMVSIGLLAIAGLQTRAMRANRTARMQTEATFLAAGFLEQMRLLPFDHPYLASGAAPRRFIPGAGSVYTVRWTVIDDRPAAGTKTIRIRVSWPGAPYGSIVRMHTIIAGRPE